MPHPTERLLRERSFLTAAGTETYLLFQQGFPLRSFCAFEVLEHEDEFAKFERDYLTPLFAAAAEHGHGLLLDALVWRAHADFVAALGYPPEDVRRLNASAVARMRAAADEWRRRNARTADDFPVLVAADLGPRGDGYQVGSGGAPSVAAAEDYHRVQIEATVEAGADLVCALTMTTANEALGIARATARLGAPLLLSPTVETDGRLPDGSLLGDFIARVDDEAPTPPLFYMVNCAHPAHLAPTLDEAADRGEAWLGRLRGFRANASCKSHAELDESTELDRGDPKTLAREIAALQRTHDLRVVGGCCGTDAEHLAAIARAIARSPLADVPRS